MTLRKISNAFLVLLALVSTSYAARTSSISGSGGTPAGSNTEVQYNDSGVFGSTGAFTYTKGTGILQLSNVAFNSPILSLYQNNSSPTAGTPDEIDFYSNTNVFGTPTKNLYGSLTLTPNAVTAVNRYADMVLNVMSGGVSSSVQEGARVVGTTGGAVPNFKITGQLIAGTGANTLTTAAGLIDATKLTGLVPNASIDGSSITKQGVLSAGSNITFSTTATGISIASTGGGGTGSSSFTYTFNPDQAKLPGANPAVISNSTSSLTSSLLFDDTSTETVTWSTILRNFNSGSLYADVFYTMASATSGTVNWGVYLACITDGDAVDVDAKTFASVNSNSGTVAGTAGYLKVITVTLSNNDSCAAGDLMTVKLERRAGSSDTATGDAEVRKLRVYEQ